MSYRTRSSVVLVILSAALLQLSFPIAAQETLGLARAEQLALERDTLHGSLVAKVDALEQQSIADQQLPDPKVQLGLVNFPTDTFRRDQEPMTQVLVGVQQAFPRGDSLQIRSAQTGVRAQRLREMARNREAMVRRDVSLAWYELYYWLQAEDIIEHNRNLFSQLLNVTQYQYSSGRRKQQDVIRAQLEMSQLDDRIAEVRGKQDVARASLSRWIGEQAAAQGLVNKLPEAVALPARKVLQDRLAEHPKLRAATTDIEVQEKDVALAREAYKPEWMLGVNYGIRDGRNADGSNRADFLSAMVTVDIPLFSGKRQDRRLEARQHQLQAAKFAFDDQYRELNQMLDSSYAEWERLQERERLYKSTLLPQARQNAESALLAYQNDTADFANVMRARITELDIELKFLRITLDMYKAQAKIAYLAGDRS